LNRIAIVSLLLIPAGIAGCADFATPRNFAAVGTVLGAGAGVALGAATGHIGEGVMLGAAAGGLAGGLGGSAMDNYARKKAQNDLLKGVQQDMLVGKTAAPATGTASPEGAKKSQWVDTSQKKRVWVEEKLAEGKIIPAHFEERTIPSGHWVEVDEPGGEAPASQAARIQ